MLLFLSIPITATLHIFACFFHFSSAILRMQGMEHPRNMGLILLMMMYEDVISMHRHFQKVFANFPFSLEISIGYFHFCQFITLSINLFPKLFDFYYIFI